MRIMIALTAVIASAVIVSYSSSTTFDNDYAEAKTKHLASSLALALEAYKTDYGECPHGTATEMMRSLLGDNPRKMVYFEAPDSDLDLRGELVDFWRTPYQIDLDAKPHPHVSSAGKNKVFDGDAKGSDDICSWR